VSPPAALGAPEADQGWRLATTGIVIAWITWADTDLWIRLARSVDHGRFCPINGIST